LTKGRIAAAHRRFNGISQMAPVCTTPNTCRCFVGPTLVQIPNGMSIGSAVFAQLTADSRYTLQRVTPFPHLKLSLFIRRSGPPSNAWFPIGPPEFLTQTASIGSAVFAELTSVIDRQTDHDTWSVTIGRIYVRSTATRPNMVKVFCIRRHILPHMDGLFVLATWRHWTHPTQQPKLHLDGRGLFSRATSDYLYIVPILYNGLPVFS